MNSHAVLLVSCSDRKGIVATIANFLYTHNANIVHADEHKDMELNLFFLRVEWELKDFTLSKQEFTKQFQKIAKEFKMEWQVNYNEEKPKVAFCIKRRSLLGRFIVSI